LPKNEAQFRSVFFLNFKRIFVPDYNSQYHER
jgi:hypothetical protein